MKKSIHSFLFIFLHILAQLCVPNNSHSQNLKDSLEYYYTLATNPKNETDLSRAYDFYKRHKEQSLLLKDTLNAISDLRFMASIQKNLGFLHDSEASATEALKLLDQIKTNESATEAKLGLYNHLGILHRSFYNYVRALDFYEMALKITKTPKDSMTLLNNKANIFIDQENYELAVKQLSLVYNNSLKYKDSLQIARALDNFGFAESKLNLPSALPHMLEALKIRTQQHNIKEIYISHSSLSKYYLKNKDLLKANFHAQQAYSLAKSIKSTSLIEDALSNIINLNNNSYVLEYKNLKDSIAKSIQLNRNLYSYNKYNYDKQEKELFISEQKREKQKFIYTSVGIIVLTSVLFIYFLIKIKHKRDKLNDIYITETRISQKVHDELANDIYNIMNRIQNQSAKAQDFILNPLAEVYKKTRNISHESSAINLNNTYYHLEIKEMLNAYGNEQTSISIIGIDKEIFKDIKDHKKIVMERVLKELMTNMKKHSKASNVLIRFKKEKKKMHITYADDGVGFKKKEYIKSNGLQNAENRIKNIKGSFNFDTEKEKGVTIELSFPI